MTSSERHGSRGLRARGAQRRLAGSRAGFASPHDDTAVDLDGQPVALVDAEQVEILAGAHLTEFASRRFDPDAVDRAWSAFDAGAYEPYGADPASAVFPFWMLYDWTGKGGMSTARRCLQADPPRSPTLRAFIDAAAAAPWSVLVLREVLTYDVSRFVDLLTGRSIQVDGVWGHVQEGHAVLAKPVQVPSFVSWALVGGAGEPLTPDQVACLQARLTGSEVLDVREWVRLIRELPKPGELPAA